MCIRDRYNFAPHAGHHVSVGGNVRVLYLSPKQQYTEQLNPIAPPYVEQLVGAFAVDRWKLSDRFVLEGQLRGDFYSGTEVDWATRLTAFYLLDERRDQNLRFSFARAFRSPQTALRATTRTSVYHPLLGTYLFNLNQGDDLKNEQTWALEAGYTTRLRGPWTFRSDAYYQRFERLIGYRITGAGPTFYTPANIGGADSWGIETELAAQNKIGKLSLWHCYNDFETDAPDQLIRSYVPAKHKFGCTARLFLPDRWTLNAIYRYCDVTPIAGETVLVPVGHSHRFDLAIAKGFSDGRGEILSLIHI